MLIEKLEIPPHIIGTNRHKASKWSRIARLDNNDIQREFIGRP